MSKRRSLLSGSWSGAYRYRFSGRETVFNAQIEERGGAFIGSIQEPNDFADAGPVLHASIEGSREGSSVSFIKFYDHANIRHSIRYEGQIDPNLTSIEGRWTIGPQSSGTFFMVRDDDGEAVDIEEAAEIELRR